MSVLDPLTEARLQEAFTSRCVVSAREVARIVGIDYARVLEDIEAGRLLGVTFGKRTEFTANHVRLYLGRAPECPSTSGETRSSISTTFNTGANATRGQRAKPAKAQPTGWSERRGLKLGIAPDERRIVVCLRAKLFEVE